MKGRFRRPKGIPVGKDGYVPEREIVRRYQEVGDFSDSNTDDPVILPRKLTPQEIEQWWEDPSVCDIEGIDTKDSDIYSVPLSIRGRKRKALKRIAVLSDRKESDRIKKILAVANPTEKMILYLGAGLGLRREEIATIKLSDFKGNKVMVNGKGHGRGKLVEKEVPQSVLRAIEEYLPYREETIAQHGDRANGALIAIPYRTHSPTASIRFVEQSMRDLEEKSKIKATCHTLRRFYCTNLFDAGVEQDTVRRMMRHSHLDTTLNHYLYADPRKIRGATTAVDDALDL